MKNTTGTKKSFRKRDNNKLFRTWKICYNDEEWLKKLRKGNTVISDESLIFFGIKFLFFSLFRINLAYSEFIIFYIISNKIGFLSHYQVFFSVSTNKYSVF